LTLKKLLKFLTLFNNRVKLFSNNFVIILFKAGTFLVDLCDCMIAFGLDLGDLGVDLCCLFTLGD